MTPLFNFYRRAASKLPFFKVAFMPLATLAAAAFAYSAHGQTNTNEAWYQIEVIIIERLTPSSNTQTEQWPKDIVLAYPTISRYLANPFETLAVEDNTEPTPETPTASQPSEPATIEGAIEPKEHPFQILAEEDQQLAGIAKRIKRTNHLHLLFHQAWRQPVTSEDLAPAIVVQAGKQFDDHYELEGSVKISVSRYLHIDSNLWLTAFEANYGQPQGQWPELPAAPINVTNIVIEPASDEVPVAANESQAPLSSENGTGDATTMNSAETQIAATQESKGSQITQPKLESLLFDSPTTAGGFNFGSGITPTNDTIELEQAQNYVVTQIVTLQQQRRMRSGELHYIDHPKMGLIVKVTPYEKNSSDTAEQ